MSCAGAGPSAKTCFRVQQTQKSFSMTPALMSPRKAAASRNRSPRSRGSILATSSMTVVSLLRRHLLVADDSIDRVRHPTHGIAALLEEPPLVLDAELGAELGQYLGGEPVLPD